MPSVSVVVPVFEVERYLAECLQSVARQTVEDLEVIVVDDGSTDGSRHIAERFAAHDPRFRVVGQANRGLGAARNAGAALATGEFLAFLDADDVLPATAYERLLTPLRASGSDFATGNVLRLSAAGTTQAPFLAKAFARDRTRTHVTRHRALLADRTAWNKLFRRAFWEAQALRFPEGVWHEDIPVMVPAHFRAAAVDVVAAPVYHWRRREDGGPSITQRRLERRVMRDRLDAVEQVLAFLEQEGPRGARRWYQQRLAGDDLRLHLDLLDQADAGYRIEFLGRARDLLAGLPASRLRPLPAVDRLKWHLARAGREAELLEVLRRQHAGRFPAPVRRRGRWYGSYPFRGDGGVRVPDRTYRLGRIDADLALEVRLDAMERDGDALRLAGSAHLGGLDARREGDQRVRVDAVRAGRWRAVHARTLPLRLPTRATRDAAAPAALAWAGFEARLPAAVLAPAGGWRPGRYDLCAHVRTAGLSRRRTRFALAAPGLAGAVHLPAPEGLRVKALCTRDGLLRVDVADRWLVVDAHEPAPGQLLRLTGHGRVDPGAWRLELRRRSDGRVVRGELHADAAGAFTADVPLTPLRTAAAPLLRDAADAGAQERWDLAAVRDGAHVALELPADVPGRALSTTTHALSLVADDQALATVTVQDRVAVAALPAPVPAPRVRRAARPAAVAPPAPAR